MTEQSNSEHPYPTQELSLSLVSSGSHNELRLTDITRFFTRGGGWSTRSPMISIESSSVSMLITNSPRDIRFALTTLPKTIQLRGLPPWLRADIALRLIESAINRACTEDMLESPPLPDSVYERFDIEPPPAVPPLYEQLSVPIFDRPSEFAFVAEWNAVLDTEALATFVIPAGAIEYLAANTPPCEDTQSTEQQPPAPTAEELALRREAVRQAERRGHP